jgi:predicted nucleic acid-binding protein
VAGVIVLDASVVIAHLGRNDAHHERVTRLLADLAGQPKIMSALTRAEVLMAPARATVDARLARVGTERGLTVRPRD